MDIPIEVQVIVFFKEFKSIVTNEGRLYVINREKNTKALINLRLTRKIRERIILNISKENYCSGPKPDKNQPGVIWEFGRVVNGKDIYIKLKIAAVVNEKIAKCISFHEAEFPLDFPLGK